MDKPQDSLELQQPPIRSSSRFCRFVCFRLLAVCLGLLPFLLVEGAFVALDWGRPDWSEDPFVGFRSVRPLFALNESTARYEIPSSRQAFFCADSFQRDKGPREFRIFCLGGSTVQGRPFAIETSFTTWLELELQAASPGRDWQVVNCGGVSYASYRLIPILEEVLRYEPDLIVVYTGHNEFLEDRTYSRWKEMPDSVAAPAGWLARTRTWNVMRSGFLDLCGREARLATPTLRTEVNAMLDYRDGLQFYHRDEEWRRRTIRDFEFNLRRMVRLCDDASIPIAMVNPVCNLRDCPPFKSQHRDGMTEEEQARWNSLVEESVACRAADRERSQDLLLDALKIDDRHAGLHYLLASSFEQSGDANRARTHYLLAKEEDVCPLRILDEMQDAICRVAKETDTPLVDVRRRVCSLSPDGIPGRDHLADHVHPTIETHQMIANWIFEELARQKLVEPTSGWQDARDRSFRSHYESLDDLYFVQGTQRLRALQLWTQGRAEGVFGETPATRIESAAP